MDDEDEDTTDIKYRVSASARDADEGDERTVFGSANASKFSTPNRSPKAEGKRPSIGLRRRFSGYRDVENLPPSPPAAAGTALGTQRWRFAGMSMGGLEESGKKARYRKLVKELKRGDRVDVKIHPMCLFLLRDGTVISIHRGAFRVER